LANRIDSGPAPPAKVTDVHPDRRALLKQGLLGGGLLAAQGLMPAWARSGTPGIAPALPTLSGDDIRLSVGHSEFSMGGQSGHAVTVNGTMPAPLIRLREGQTARLSVTNTLDEDTSIHWHGLLLPFQMDGVPGISFPGIAPGQTFVYEFPVRQSGTYWYHSHSGLQEAMGHFGPIIIDPARTDPVACDREHVVMLSDWSFIHPHELLERLKQSPGYFNRRRTTVEGLLSGEDRMSLDERRMWAGMRMDPRDILDVNGSVYTYLINGHGPAEAWTGLFRPGERVRLRIINAAAMSIFNVRIPGLAMTVVAVDGMDVRPVEIDEFQISVAETYDVIVQPRADAAYAVVAEAIDRSGMAVGMLAPRLGMQAAVPPLREVPNLTLADMGMGGMDHGAMDHSAMGHDMGQAAAPMDHGDMSMRDPENAPANMQVGVGVDMISPAPANRLGERPLGLEDVPHRVLVYTDLVALRANPLATPPTRHLEIHLTGNMERFMWGFDGRRFSELVEPIRFARDERVRVTLVNDTMMSHPIHLHGHFFELVTGAAADRQPWKHTVNVAPGSQLSFDLTASEPGDWAFHCHLLMHMHAGMFNVVTVRPLDGDPA
jgi:CopA family copper-resistance protein